MRSLENHTYERLIGMWDPDKHLRQSIVPPSCGFPRAANIGVMSYLKQQPQNKAFSVERQSRAQIIL